VNPENITFNDSLMDALMESSIQSSLGVMNSQRTNSTIHRPRVVNKKPAYGRNINYQKELGSTQVREIQILPVSSYS